MKAKIFIDRTVETLLIISLTGMMLSVVIQVFTRFFMESAPAWTEEASRIFFIYAVVLGAGLGIRENAFVFLDYFIEKFNDGLKHKIQLATKIIIILFGFVFLYYSVQFVQLGSSETSPALEINMSYLFAGLPVLGALIIYYGVFDLLSFNKQNKS